MLKQEKGYGCGLYAVARWIKKNLVAISRNGKMFDKVVCEFCNIRA